MLRLKPHLLRTRRLEQLLHRVSPVRGTRDEDPDVIVGEPGIVRRRLPIPDDVDDESDRKSVV